jgi:hypothetical protein
MGKVLGPTMVGVLAFLRLGAREKAEGVERRVMEWERRSAPTLE